MSFPTLSVPVRVAAPLRLSRKEEMKRLRRAHRIRDRRRRFDVFQYRFRHVTAILASGFLAVTVLVIAKATGLI